MTDQMSPYVILAEGEDYFAEDGEPIELTERGIERMRHAHAVGQDAVIAIGETVAMIYRASSAERPQRRLGLDLLRRGQ
jgi:hypothetical protein